MLAKTREVYYLEVATTEVRAIWVVVAIERQTYINPVFYIFLYKVFVYLHRLSHVLAQLLFCIQHSLR